MNKANYRAGIKHGIRLSNPPGEWPLEIKGLGRAKGGQPISKCSRCPPGTHPAVASTFCTYGGLYFCKPCAILEAKAAGAAA